MLPSGPRGRRSRPAEIADHGEVAGSMSASLTRAAAQVSGRRWTPPWRPQAQRGQSQRRQRHRGGGVGPAVSSRTAAPSDAATLARVDRPK